MRKSRVSATESVPAVDLRLQHARVAEQIQSAMDEVISTSAFILGPHLERFESEFASYCRAEHVIGVGNGTDAIELALRSVGIGESDEVILPANTFVATAEAIVRCGAVPVFVDCDTDFLIDPALIAQRVTTRTRAVIPVHLYGQMAAVEEVRAAVGPDVLIVEDAAQAQGAQRWGRRAGSVADVAATSFYPGKNLGAYGDAGAVITSSDSVCATVRSLRNHGGVNKYEHSELGLNSRLDAIQAAVLSVKLKHLDEWNSERGAAAAEYARRLGDQPSVLLPRVCAGNDHVWHLYVVRVPERNQVLADMNSSGIGAGVHYPTPVHLLPAFRYLGYQRGDFPIAERLSQEILSLPIFPGITPDQQRTVVEHLVRALR
jgi:dTDP-4-amino-4,6-dideoxygalactose transaminase